VAPPSYSNLSDKAKYSRIGIDVIYTPPKNSHNASVDHSFYAEGRWTKKRNSEYRICHICDYVGSECDTIDFQYAHRPFYNMNVLCPLIHWLRFGIDKEGQRYLRGGYWLYIWIIPLTFPIWGLFYIYIRFVLNIWSGVKEECYDEAEGSCACRPLLLLLLVPLTLIVSILMFLVIGTTMFVLCIFRAFAIPCIYASIPAIKDTEKTQLVHYTR